MSRRLQIPNVPDDVHAELAARAEQAGLSLNDYILRQLAQLGRRGGNAEFFRRARSIPGPRLSHESIVTEIRAMRGEGDVRPVGA